MRLYCEFIFILSSALLLYSCFPEYKTVAYLLWPFVFIALWIKWFCNFRLKIPLSIDLFRFLPHAKLFKDSIRYLNVAQTAVWSLPLFICSFLLLYPSIPLWLVVAIGSFIGQIQVKKRAEAPAYQWNFPTEISHPIGTEYPLLRKTVGFTGKRQFKTHTMDQPHVIFLFLESFRAKNVGCLGASIGASPCFDAWAEEGTLFTNFQANGLQTFRAVVSSLFGIPAHLKTMSLQPFYSIPMVGLPEILKENGYHPALFQASYTSFDWTYPFFMKHGFETIVGREDLLSEQKTSWGVTDEALFEAAQAWLEKQKTPAFLSLFTISNHHPWESPLPFPTPPGLPNPYARFLQTFRYTDHCLGKFVEQLKKSGILDKSLLFIMGDHGQDMGEHGDNFAIHNNLHRENIHVPLLILGSEKKRIDTPCSQVDLLPTLLDMLNIQAIHHSVGRSLLREADRPVFCSLQREETQFAAITAQGKLISNEYYDLREEKRLVLPEQLKIETLSYFQSIEEIYKRKAWAPESSEKIYLTTDLSNTMLKDSALFEMGKDRGKDIYELTLTNSPLFTDKALEWIADHCPHLSILNAAHCLLMTPRGINAILNRCTYLRQLNLEGNDEVGDFAIEHPIYLNVLHLKDCHNLRGEGLLSIAQKCPHLDYLVASLEKIEEEHLEKAASHLDQLLFLFFQNGLRITDDVLNEFLRANKRLSVLTLENFPLIEKLDFSHNKWMNSLKLINCPNLKDVSGLSAEKFSAISCPKLSTNA